LRLGDFADYKKKAKEKFEKDPEKAVVWVLENIESFRCAKFLFTIPELADKVIKECQYVF